MMPSTASRANAPSVWQRLFPWKTPTYPKQSLGQLQAPSFKMPQQAPFSTGPRYFQQKPIYQPQSAQPTSGWFSNWWPRPWAASKMTIPYQAAFMSTQAKNPIDPYTALGIRQGEKNPYVILGLSENATHGEVNSAHRKLTILWHPDRHSDKDTNEVMKLINWARDSIITGEKSGRYESESSWRDTWNKWWGSKAGSQERSSRDNERKKEEKEQRRRQEEKRKEEEARQRYMQQQEAFRAKIKKTGAYDPYYQAEANSATKKLIELIKNGASDAQSIEQLINDGADPNVAFIVPKFLNREAMYVTPLQYALLMGAPESVVRKLITPKSANFGGVDAATGNDLAYYPYLLAAIFVSRLITQDPANFKMADILDVLGRKGANINQATQSEGKTLMHLAAELYLDLLKTDDSIFLTSNINAKILKQSLDMLLKRYVDPELRDKSGKSALNYFQAARSSRIPYQFEKKAETSSANDARIDIIREKIKKDFEEGRFSLSLADINKFGPLFNELASKYNFLYISKKEIADRLGKFWWIEPKKDDNNPTLYLSLLDLALLHADKINPQVIERLISATPVILLNKDSSWSNLGLSPLYLAARTGNVEYLIQMVKKGANPNIIPKESSSPLQQAVNSFLEQLKGLPVGVRKVLFAELLNIITLLRNIGARFETVNLSKLSWDERQQIRALFGLPPETDIASREEDETFLRSK